MFTDTKHARPGCDSWVPCFRDTSSLRSLWMLCDNVLYKIDNFTYLLTYLLTHLLTYLLNCLLTYCVRLGLAVTVVHAGSPLLVRGFGSARLRRNDTDEVDLPVTENTKFAIASLSKAFTATLIGILLKEQESRSVSFTQAHRRHDKPPPPSIFRALTWLAQQRCGRTISCWLVARQNVGLWPANFLCPALDLQLTGDHLCR